MSHQLLVAVVVILSAWCILVENAEGLQKQLRQRLLDANYSQSISGISYDKGTIQYLKELEKEFQNRNPRNKNATEPARTSKEIATFKQDCQFVKDQFDSIERIDPLIRFIIDAQTVYQSIDNMLKKIDRKQGKKPKTKGTKVRSPSFRGTEA